MRVCVFGAGAIGGYVGGLLARSGVETILIARGAHLTALRELGLTIETPEERFVARVAATDRTEDVRNADLVLLCVKTYDTERACRALSGMLAPDGAVLTLQNGIDPLAPLSSTLSAHQCFAGAPFILSVVTRPGHVTRGSRGARVIFGVSDGKDSERARRVHSLFESAGLSAQISANITSVLWERFVIACAFNGVTAALQSTVGALLESPEARSMLLAAAQEVHALGVKMGHKLATDLVERSVAQLESLPRATQSSLYRDLVRNQPLELDALNAKVVELARAHGLSAPTNEAIVHKLRPFASGASGGVFENSRSTPDNHRAESSNRS